MVPIQRLRKVKPPLDTFDFVYGMFPWLTGFAAFVSWAKLIVRALRGEQVGEDWRTTYSTAAFIAALAMRSATEVRESVALRGSVVEMHKALQEAAADAEARDKRTAALQDQLYRVTVKMAWVAGFTLAAAIGSVVVAFVR